MKHVIAFIILAAASVAAPLQSLSADPTASSGGSPSIKSVITVKQAWLRATPKGAKVAGGYATITNTGAAPDRLLAATLASTPKGEVHAMSMENGVMHMSRLAGGLPIAAGATLTLAPGGNHLMFLEPAAPLKESETIKGTLTFEKAGVVPVTFAVAGMAAKTPPGAKPSSGPGMDSKSMNGMTMDGMDMSGMDMKKP